MTDLEVRALHYRMDDLEEWLAGLTGLVGWLLFALSGYLIWKSGVIKLEVFHG